LSTSPTPSNDVNQLVSATLLQADRKEELIKVVAVNNLRLVVCNEFFIVLYPSLAEQ
jgi:hypothetical protein